VLLAAGLGFTLTAPLAASPQSGSDRILNELVAVHPYSSPGAMTSTPDGNYLYVAEGGSIAIIEADPGHPGAVTNYKNPRKRRPVSSRGVLPVNMVLDPDITLPQAEIGYEPTYGPNDLLYIAGGRDGLWVMQADVTAPAQPNLAFRVDDATIVGPSAEQDSRRWCSDVDLITLGNPPNEKTYLLALFAAKDDSQLRMYDLDAVRAIASSGSETGTEIFAHTETTIGRHSSLDPGENLHSFAFGMDVDEATNYVYVAMGYHGLVRAKLKKNYPYPTIEWGPYFGDGSPYAEPSVDSDLYGDLEYWESGALVFKHPPLFLDVAVDSRAPESHWVWAAADHVGVVGFNLGASGGWSDFIYGATGGDFHQEGIKTVESGTPPPPLKYWSQLVAGTPEDVMAFARRVQVIESSATLLATTTPTPFLRYPGARNMGRHMFYDFSHVGGLPNCEFADAPDVDTGYTIAYYLDYTNGMVSGDINAAAVVEIGRQVYAPEIQDADSLAFFAGRHAPDTGFRIPAPDRGHVYDHKTARFDFVGNWEPKSVPPGSPPAIPLGAGDATLIRERKGTDRPGRWTYRISLNKADPRVLATTSNDGGLPADGPLVLDLGDPGGARIEANFTLGNGHTDDTDCTHGMCFEPSAAVATGDLEYRFAYRRWPGTGSGDAGPHWRFTRTDRGQNVTDEVLGVAPHEEKTIYFSMPPDKFGHTGAYYYMGGGYCEAYTTETGDNLLFVCARETPGGIWVLDLDELIEAIDDEDGYDTDDGDHYDLGDSGWDDVVVGELTAHPEYWNIPDYRFYSSEADAEDFIWKNGLWTRVLTWHPQFTRLPLDGAGPADTWVLAVPCMYVSCPEDLQVFSTHPRWKPDDVFHAGAGLNKMMVRLFNIQDPGKISEQYQGTVGSHLLPAHTLVGPDAESSATFLRNFHVVDDQSADRYFCAVADLGGHVQVFETTGVFHLIPPDHSSGADIGYLHFGGTYQPTPFARYDAIDDLSDHLPSNVYDVEVDQTSWQYGGDWQEKTYLYVSVKGVGLQVLCFDVNATSVEDRLVEVELIQTPGEVAFLHLAEWPEASNPLCADPHGYINEKILFVGDAFAGFRIYTYGF